MSTGSTPRPSELRILAIACAITVAATSQLVCDLSYGWPRPWRGHLSVVMALGLLAMGIAVRRVVQAHAQPITPDRAPAWGAIASIGITAGLLSWITWHEGLPPPDTVPRLLRVAVCLTLFSSGALAVLLWILRRDAARGTAMVLSAAVTLAVCEALLPR